MSFVRALAGCGLLLLFSPDGTFAQSCNPTTLRLHPEDEVAALTTAATANPIRVTAGAAGNFVAGAWDQGNQVFPVGLQGQTITPAQLNNLTLTLGGFRFPPDPQAIRIEQNGTMCIGHFGFHVLRVWRVQIVSSPDSILVDIEGPGGGNLTTPGFLPQQPLDWSTPLKVRIHPFPRSPAESYAFNLQPETFTKSPCTGAAPGVLVLCHKKDDITGLMSKGKHSNPVLRDLQIAKKSVDQIDFRLERP